MARHSSNKNASSRRRSGRGGASRRARGQGNEQGAGRLPGVEGLRDVPAFDDLRVDDAQREAFGRVRCEVAARSGDAAAEALGLGCVVRLDRGFPLVAGEDGACVRAEHAVAFAKGEARERGIMPAVGDVVACGRPEGHDMGVIEAVLPRRASFERWRGGRRGEFQTLAANVDTVLVVAALGTEPVPLARIARSLVLVRDCGSDPAVVLTKTDRAAEAGGVERDVARVRGLVGDGVPIALTSSALGEGLDEVRALVPERTCAMILGESGAGKSSLLNALLGYEALATARVRDRDDAGRHTTVARVMVKLPGAGVLCDAPGLRSLPLVGHERGLALTFPEVAERAGQCRFRDCTHTGEPGCAVAQALAAGELDEARVEAWRALAAEMRESASSLDPDVVL